MLTVNRKLSFVLVLWVFLLAAVCAPASHAGDERRIATVVPRSGFIYAYDEKGSQMFALNAGSGDKDGLVGYTATTVSVRRGGFIYVYNEKGSQISAVSAGD